MATPMLQVKPAASYSPGPERPSTIGAEGLNCSVRNGKRCFPLAITTGNCRDLRLGASLKTAQQPIGYHLKKTVKPSDY